MPVIINLEDWVVKEDLGNDFQSNSPGPGPGGMPAAGQNLPGMTPPQQGMDPSIANQSQDMGKMPNQPKNQKPDPSSDPQIPDMPNELGGEGQDFELWKKEFLKESIKGDVEQLKSMIISIRDRDLDPYQRKFVEDNLQILFLREHSNIQTASDEIRKMIREQLDHNNPATSVVHHISAVLEQQPLLSAVFVKLTGLLGTKGDMHRKFIASLTGSIQVGSGAYTEDIIYNDVDYSIRMSTRFNSRFGEVHLGKWSLKQDDPERYLQAPELKRLEDGSPEEKDVLRRRIVMESICDAFKTRAFIINVVGTDGTVYTLGWDLATSLKSAYTEGKLVVRTKQDDAAEAMIDDDGAIVPFMDLKIMYEKETGQTDGDGKPEKQEHEFMVRKDGQLFLTAVLPIVREAASSFQGIILKETPWTGNPTDLKVLSRCVPSSPEILLRQC
jgi:hypothetical protein